MISTAKRFIISVAAFFAITAAAQNNAQLLERASLFEPLSPTAALDVLARMHGDSDLEAKWLQAASLQHKGAYADAYELFKAIDEAYPWAPARTFCRMAMADCLYAQNLYSEALALYRTLDTSALTPKEANRLDYRLGYSAIQTGRDALAAEAFGRVRLAPERIGALFYRGVLAYRAGNYSQARTLLTQSASSVAPGRCADYYLAAIALHDKNYAEAAEKAGAMASKNFLGVSEKAQMHRVAGEALWHLGRHAEALEMLARYLATTASPEPSAAYIAGVGAYQKGDYERAGSLLEQALASTDPFLLQSAYLYLGNTLEHTGQKDAALLAFNKSAKISDADPDVRRNALYNALVLSIQGNNLPFSSAADACAAFIEQYPAGADADRVRLYLADGYASSHDYRRALELIDQIPALSPKGRKTRTQLQYRIALEDLAEQNPAEALRWIAKARQGASGELARELNLLEGRALLMQDKPSEAAAALKKYLSNSKKAPNSAEASYFLAYAYLNSGNYAEAAGIFNSLAAEKSLPAVEKADIFSRLADIEYAGHNFDAAADLYDRAMATGAAGADNAAFGKASMLVFARRYPQAVQAFDALMAAYPQSAHLPEAILGKARAFVSMGRNADAAKTYGETVLKFPGTPQHRTALLEHALTLLDSKRPDDAAGLLRKLISTFPTSEQAFQGAAVLKNIYSAADAGDGYLRFMASVANAPAVEAAEADNLTFKAALAKFRNNAVTAPLEDYIAHYPHGKGVPEALEVLAENCYANDEIPQALDYYRRLQELAPDAAAATRARTGVMRTARDLGEDSLALASARAILASDAASDKAVQSEAVFTLGAALKNLGNEQDAIDTWATVADRTADIYGVKSAFNRAQTLLDAGEPDKAMDAAKALSTSGSPHKYWIARAFILISDVYAQKGNSFEAREYLEALRDSYPGSETDIAHMIDSRIENLQNNGK